MVPEYPKKFTKLPEWAKQLIVDLENECTDLRRKYAKLRTRPKCAGCEEAVKRSEAAAAAYEADIPRRQAEARAKLASIVIPTLGEDKP